MAWPTPVVQDAGRWLSAGQRMAHTLTRHILEPTACTHLNSVPYKNFLASVFTSVKWG